MDKDGARRCIRRSDKHGASRADFFVTLKFGWSARQQADGVGPCVNNYAVLIRGDGTVLYEGSGLLEVSRTRSISPDDVVALVNEFLRARFLDI